MRIILAIFLFLTSSLVCAEQNKLHDAPNLPFANTDAVGSTIVGGCINALTGSYVATHHDWTIPSSEPLPLIRIYTDNVYFPSILHACWTHNFRGEARCQYRESADREALTLSDRITNSRQYRLLIQLLELISFGYNNFCTSK